MLLCAICSVTIPKPRRGQSRCSRKCNGIYYNTIKKEHKNKWYLKNKEQVLDNYYTWKENFPERRKESSERYRRNNSEYYAEYAARRRFSKEKATPPWADLKKIQEIYKKAKDSKLEVDHIIPLKHHLVCGLHVPDNLQLLSREENAMKNNKFDIDVQLVIV